MNRWPVLPLRVDSIMPPFRYVKARFLARFHVQVELEGVPDTPGKRGVSARVVRVFRGAELRIGDTVNFEIWCARKQREMEDVPIGVGYVDFDALQHARYIEVYLDGEPPDCSVPREQYTIIEIPSDDPVLPAIPPGSVKDLVELIADPRFHRPTVGARIKLIPSDVCAVRFDSALRLFGAAEYGADGKHDVNTAHGVLAVHRKSDEIDLDGPPAAVLRVLHATLGIPTPMESDCENPMAVPKTAMNYAVGLARAGETHGALVMVDIALTDLERLSSERGREEVCATLAQTLITKGMLISRLNFGSNAQAFFHRANTLMAESDRSKNSTVRWALEYFDLATIEERAGQHASAATLFSQAVMLLEQSPDDPGSYLPKALLK